jgi:hypothetical protein
VVKEKWDQVVKEKWDQVRLELAAHQMMELELELMAHQMMELGLAARWDQMVRWENQDHGNKSSLISITNSKIQLSHLTTNKLLDSS